MSNVTPTCQTGCDVIPPDFSFNDCSPDTNRGQIDRIYIANRNVTPLADWTSLAEWTARLDNSANDITKIRFLNVIAEKPVPESNPLEISRERKVVIDKTFTLTGTIDETDATNYEALREIECGGNFKVWYQAGKYLYGGDEGIDAFIVMDDQIPLDRKELNVFPFTITWENQFHPDRTTNPLPTL